jgi:hypothetical protein
VSDPVLPEGPKVPNVLSFGQEYVKKVEKKARPVVRTILTVVVAAAVGFGGGYLVFPAGGGDVVGAVNTRIAEGCVPLVNGARASSPTQMAVFKQLADQGVAALRSQGATNVGYYVIDDVIYLYAESCK